MMTASWDLYPHGGGSVWWGCVSVRRFVGSSRMSRFVSTICIFLYGTHYGRRTTRYLTNLDRESNRAQHNIYTRTISIQMIRKFQFLLLPIETYLAYTLAPAKTHHKPTFQYTYPSLSLSLSATSIILSFLDLTLLCISSSYIHSFGIELILYRERASERARRIVSWHTPSHFLAHVWFLSVFQKKPNSVHLPIHIYMHTYIFTAYGFCAYYR